MIRRESDRSYFLITQTDHAQLAAQLATEVGGSRFESVLQSSNLLPAIAQHDAGWPIHDDLPTLNSSRQPLDVFEVPRALALTIWTASSDRAAAIDPYTGLLVSLHSLALSIYVAQNSSANKSVKPHETEQLHAQFILNKFQHREVERQEQLRRQLGFTTEIPLLHGLAEIGANPADDLLRYHFHLLQSMDLISLALCCTNLPAAETGPVQAMLGTEPIKLKIRRDWSGRLNIKPWPFRSSKLKLEVPYRRVPRRAYPDLEEFRSIYSQAKLEYLPVVANS